jgi:hypothetical protein
MKKHFPKLFLFGAFAFIAAASSVDAQSIGASTAVVAVPVKVSAVSQPINSAMSVADRAVLEQKFRDSKKCLEADIEAEQLRNSFNVCQEQLLGSPGRKSCDLKTKGANMKSQSLTSIAIAAGCPADTDAANRSFSMSLVNAARAGIADAQVCYLKWAGPLSAPGDIARYKSEASLYIKKGLENGDWRVVRLLATSPEGVEGNDAGIMANLDIIGKWFTAFRANRLLELGASGPYKAALHKKAQDAASHLSEAQIVNGNAWAKQEFRKYFANSPALMKAPTTCLASTGDAAE